MIPDTTRRTFLSVAGVSTLSAASYARVFGAVERIGVGVIGYGLIGKTHLATLRQIGDVDVVAVSDCHRGRCEEGVAAAGGKAAGYPDFRRLLDDKNVHAVVVATPDHWHALMTMLACAAGKDVYVEKPLSLFAWEGDWMLTVANRTKRVVQVGTQQRSGKHYQKARELIRGGHIGTVVSVRMHALRNIAPGFGTPPDAEPPANIDYDMWLGPAPQRKYNPNRVLYHFRWFWDYAGGQLTNLGSHHLDIVDWVLGLDKVQRVTAVGGRFALKDNCETPDTQDVLYDCGSYSIAFVMREAALGEKPSFGLTFHGTRGTLGIDRRGFQVFADPNTPPANQVPGVAEGHPVGGPTAIPPPAVKPLTEPLEDRTGNSAAQYLGHVQNFIACIKDRKLPVSDLASAHRTAVACHLGNIATRLGTSVSWDWRTELILGNATANDMLVRPYRAPWDKELKALGVG